MRIAIVDKCPSRTNYAEFFDFEFTQFHLCQTPTTEKLKVKDVNIEINVDAFDLIILVGADPFKYFTKKTGLTQLAGVLIDEKYIGIVSPSMLTFKPEGKQDFDRSVARIKEVINNSGVQPRTKGDYKGITDYEEARAYLLEVLNSDSPVVAVDTEGTSLAPRRGYVLGISITYKPYQGRYIITDIFDEPLTALLQEIINRKVILMHNSKYDVKMLEYHLGLEFNFDKLHDTMVIHYALDENSGHGLKELAIKFTDLGEYDADLDEFKKQYCRRHGITNDDFTYDLIPFEIICEYASIDTCATYLIYMKLMPVLEANTKLYQMYKRILMRGVKFLLDKEEFGIPMSLERLSAARNYLNTAIEEATAKFYEFDEVKQFEKDKGKIFNPDSVVQLRSLLFDYCQLESSGKLTDTGALSTDAEVLEDLSHKHPVPGLLLTIRKLNKIKSTYVLKLLQAMDKDAKVRTGFNLTFTTSGRLSSSGTFNAQQIPRDDPIVKGCIVAPPGFKIVSQDLATAEVYYAAVLSGDKNLQSVFKSGGDLHSTIAKMVFNLPCDVSEVKSKYKGLRQAAKAITFGILYGSGPAKVAESVTKETGQPYSIEMAKENIKDYFTRFSTLKTWLTQQKLYIEKNGFIYSFFGRKRRLINVFSPDRSIAAGEVRSGINFLIQSLASDMNLLGAIDTADELKEKDMKARIFMLVHDSIVALVPDEEVEAYCEILKRNTQKDRGCSIPGLPVGIDQEIGQDYSFGKFEEYYELSGDTLVRK